MISRGCTPPTPASRLAEYRDRLAEHEADLICDGANVIDLDLDKARRVREGRSRQVAMTTERRSQQ